MNTPGFRECVRTEEKAKAGPSATLRSGRDDNSFVRRWSFFEDMGQLHNKIVIPRACNFLIFRPSRGARLRGTIEPRRGG